MILLNNNKFSNAIIIIILFLPFITTTAYAAGGETDSIGVTLRSDSALMVELLNKQRKSQQKFTVFTKKEIETPVYQILHAAVPLFIVGGVASAFDNDFKVMRSSYIPGFRYHYDDYLQYSPAVLMMIMKAAGVEGRSSWGRMLVSDAFSVAAMTFLVNGLKYTVRRERPDGSSNNSFPSGHAATAFMTATMFHKEYGLTRSPLYSVLGYSLATATAISRQFNNRHWMSDVLVGAGIGILSVELGYYLADLIFKEKGLKRDVVREFDDAYLGNPNFLGINAGYTFLKKRVNLPNGISLASNGGASAALEGAWFLNRYIGVGAKILAINSPIMVDKMPKNYETRTNYGKSMNLISFMPGIYFSYPLAYGLLVGANVSPSIDYYDGFDVELVATDGNLHNLAWINGSVNAGLQAGLSITKMTSSNFGLSLNIDYGVSFTNINGGSSLGSVYVPFSNNRAINLLSISASANAYLFKNRK